MSAPVPGTGHTRALSRLPHELQEVVREAVAQGWQLTMTGTVVFAAGMWLDAHHIQAAGLAAMVAAGVVSNLHARR
jgi:hypothetical protein